MDNILYTTGCPKCKVLEAKLASKNIPYIEVTDEGKIMATGMLSLPLLRVNGTLLNFTEAVAYVNGCEKQ